MKQKILFLSCLHQIEYRDHSPGQRCSSQTKRGVTLTVMLRVELSQWEVLIFYPLFWLRRSWYDSDHDIAITYSANMSILLNQRFVPKLLQVNNCEIVAFFFISAITWHDIQQLSINLHQNLPSLFNLWTDKTIHVNLCKKLRNQSPKE